MRRYELDVDSATGLILALREHDALDRVVGEVAWEELSFARLTPQERVRAVRHDPTWRGARATPSSMPSAEKRSSLRATVPSRRPSSMP